MRRRVALVVAGTLLAFAVALIVIFSDELDDALGSIGAQ